MCVLCYARPVSDDVRITVGGRLALTVRQALDRYREQYGIDSMEAMHSIIRRAGLAVAGKVDGRTPVYFAKALDTLMENRPGKGNRR